ncbi:MAG: anaerobic sulfatase maturase [Desulfarculaceae bacterium]|nr:anaerobic sulfatase maturase [Desulfarculaceae bacterium]MCF8071117.1 anaerobic sulfatase maturase [Desulfarculaceae bacterium]MCF8101280.1 anaerobic sulfatase maturase [Desulfarculaceae bacterium]MCF8115171.1 anaerobic sulfatase maturase [Desulfarculaceae bacterium]
MQTLQKPLASLLIKPAGPDCNLSCDYCFYLEKAELFNSKQTHRMTGAILEEVVRQAMRQAGREINFIWQGGEPTLMGLDFFRKAVELQQRYGRDQTVGNGLQTNGLLIDSQWAQFLRSYQWLVGLSLDGPQHVHDHHRKTGRGQGTWEPVVESAKRLLDAEVAVNALVVVTDYSVRFAQEIYEFHKNLGLNYMQFIPCVEADKQDPSAVSSFSVPSEPYGHFLCQLFDLWMDDFTDLTPTTSIRFFDSLFYQYLGLPAPECTLLPECGNYVVVEHNGEVFSCDFFVQPAWRLGNVMYSRLSDMLNAEKQRQFGRRKAHWPDTCGDCRWLGHCAGGCPKDRLRGQGPEKQNHLCSAYQIFFEYSDQRFRDLADKWKRRNQLTKF